MAHADHQQSRWKIINALHQPEVEDKLRKRAEAMGQCCCLPSFRTKADGSPLASLARCRDRLCPLCADRRGAQATERTIEIVKRFNSPRFFTFTLKHRAESLKEMLARLAAALQALRKEKAWTKRVWGGVTGVEVTRNQKTKQWHAHAHVIADGEFFPQEVLKATWLKVTGDSFIVSVEAIADRRKTARYISRYVSKPVDVEQWTPEEIREYALAMHGRRLLQTFGNAHNVKVDDDEDHTFDPGTTHLCSSQKLLQARSTGLAHAERAAKILSALGRDLSIAAGEPWTYQAIRQMPVAENQQYAMAVLRAIDFLDPSCWSDSAIEAWFDDTDYRGPRFEDHPPRDGWTPNPAGLPQALG